MELWGWELRADFPWSVQESPPARVGPVRMLWGKRRDRNGDANNYKHGEERREAEKTDDADAVVGAEQLAAQTQRSVWSVMGCQAIGMDSQSPSLEGISVSIPDLPAKTGMNAASSRTRLTPSVLK